MSTIRDSQYLMDLVKSIIPNEEVFEIEHWRGDLYRVMVKVGTGFDCYILDLFNQIIALKGHWVQTHGNHLKLREKAVGLIAPRVSYSPTIKYEWEVIIPCEYTQIVDCFDEHGLIRVVKDDKWGIIDAFNRIVVPIEYHHLSPIYPLANGQYRVIARKIVGDPEHNLIIKREYSIEKGNSNVPRLRGPVIQTITSDN